MAVPKRVRALGLSLATAAVVGAGAYAAFTAGAAGNSSGSVTASFAKTSDWGSGFQAGYTISNSTGRTVHGWSVSFDLPTGQRISSLWNGTMAASGQHITVTNPPWDGDIANGAKAAFGFVVDVAVASGSGAPQNCVINGAPCSSGASGGVPVTAPSSGTGSPESTPGSPDSTSSAAGSMGSAGSADSADSAGSRSAADSTPSSSMSPNSLTPPASSAALLPATPPSATGAYKFAPYIDTSQRRDLGALASAAGAKYVTAAFVLSANGCTPVWNGAADPAFAADLKAGLADLRSHGGDAIASFGGADGTELAQSCPDVASLKAAYRAVIDEYGFTHVDFDIEGAAGADHASITRRSQALAQLQSDYAAAGKSLDVSLTLPALPSGLTPTGVAVVADAARNGLTVSVVNLLAMDYGDWAAPSPAGKMGQFADQAAQSAHDQLKAVFPTAADARLWAMIGITPMIGGNDTAGEVFQLTDAAVVKDFAAQHHLGRLALWSLTRDKACAQPSSGAEPTCSSIQQGAYDFAHTFEAFAG